VLRPREGVLVLQTMLWPDEVRVPKFDFLDKEVTVRQQELAMAESYISALSGDFEPSGFSDGYREALEEVIQAKIAGHEVTAPVEEPRSTGQVVDLMEALRRSVAEAKSRRGEDPATAPAKTSATKGAARKSSATGTTAKKSTAKGAVKKAATKSAAAKKSAPKKSVSKKSVTKKSATRRSA